MIGRKYNNIIKMAYVLNGSSEDMSITIKQPIIDKLVIASNIVLAFLLLKDRLCK